MHAYYFVLEQKCHRRGQIEKIKYGARLLFEKIVKMCE
jgi:hypothetical protein